MMYDRFDEKMIVETFRLLSLFRTLTIFRRWIYVLGVSFRSRSLVSFLAPNSFWTLIRVATFAVGALPSTIDGFVAAENFFLLSFFLSFFLCATRTRGAIEHVIHRPGRDINLRLIVKRKVNLVGFGASMNLPICSEPVSSGK